MKDQDEQRLRVFEGNMHDALRSWYAGGGRETVEPAIVEMPFDDLLRSEDDGISDVAHEAGEYEWLQRLLGARLVFRWILAEGFQPLKIMKRLWAIGRAMNVSPFTQLTMDEQGRMFSETKAAVSWRMKVLSGLIKLRGMKAKRLPGQKTPDSAASYSRAQAGNSNRANGHRPPAARQGSFLRSLHVPTTPPKKHA